MVKKDKLMFQTKQARKKILLARAILFLHAFIILMYLIGALIVLYASWYIPIHVLLVAGTLYFHIVKGGCPFTFMEKKALKQGRGYSYDGPCYKYYVFTRFLKIPVSDTFVTYFLIVTTIIPSIIPLVYLLFIQF
jgi:hypothetical protein